MDSESRDGAGGRILGGRYRLGQSLGRGGMAEVYAAWDLTLERPVAIKLLYSHMAADRTFTERLRREARSAAALSDPNVVAVYDYGEDGERPYLAMELVEGETLAALLTREGALPIERALEIADDILAALEHVHARGIVHRDIKPQNVLITPEGRAKLADFGIASAADATAITGSGEVFGSVHYLAPERLSGHPATPAADLYAVGVLLYRALTGRLPFEGDLPAVVAAQHRNADPPAPSAAHPGLGTSLDGLVLRALAKEPAGRHQSAQAMRAEVRLLRAGPDAPTVQVLPGHMAVADQSAGTVRTVPAGASGHRPLVPCVAGIAVALLLAGLALVYGPMLRPDPEAGAPPTPARRTANGGRATPATETRTPRVSIVPTSTPTRRPAPRPAVSPDDRVQRMRRWVEAAPAGRRGKEREETLKKLEEVGEKLEEGKVEEAGKQVDELRKWVQERAQKGELDTGLAVRLERELAALRQQLP